MNLQDLETTITILRERKVTVQGSAHLDATSLMSRVNAVSSSLQDNDQPEARPAVPEMTIMGTPRFNRPPATAKSEYKPYLIIIAAIIVIIGIIVVGSFIAGLITNGGSPQGQQTATLPGKTTTPVTTIIPVTTEIPAVPAPIASPTLEPIPANGTWVCNAYPGNYTGSLKSGGWNVEVNTTGTSDYLLPVRDSLIEGSITKSEGTGGAMVVGVYYYGTLISEEKTYKPFGAIDLNQDIQKALAATPTPTPTPAPVPVALSGDLTVPSAAIPGTGVWARIYYPGNYVGYITANGRSREVNSTGDQFYQLSMSTGSIDGVMEKQDSSARNMALQIYKDGAMVASQNTTAPNGDIDLHVTI